MSPGPVERIAPINVSPKVLNAERIARTPTSVSYADHVKSKGTWKGEECRANHETRSFLEKKYFKTDDIYKYININNVIIYKERELLDILYKRESYKREIQWYLDANTYSWKIRVFLLIYLHL